MKYVSMTVCPLMLSLIVGCLVQDSAMADGPLTPAAAVDPSSMAAPAGEIGFGEIGLTIWSDPAFLEQFAESYIAASDIEPTLKAEERKQMLEVLTLLKPDEREQQLLTPDTHEAELIRAGRHEEAAALRRQKGEKAQAMRAEKVDKAVVLLKKLQGPAASAVVDFTLGNVHFQRGQYDDAAASYQVAIKKFRSFRRAWQNLGLIYMRQEKFGDALPALTRVIELGGNDSLTYGMLGFAYSSVENDLAAESAYRLAILLEPRKPNWKMGLIQSLFKQERFSEVVAMCRPMIANEPENPKLWLIQANAYIGLQQPMKAAENYEMVDRLGASTEPSLNNLGDIYINMEVFDLAVSAYVRSMELATRLNHLTRADRAIRAAKALSARGAHTETKLLIDRIDALYGERLSAEEHKDLLKMRARLAVAEGAGDEERHVLEQIVKLDPLDGEALMLLAQHSARANDIETAINYYEQAAGLEKYEADARVRHAQLLVGQGKYDQAMPLLRRAQTLKPRENVQKYLEQVERVAGGR